MQCLASELPLRHNFQSDEFEVDEFEPFIPGAWIDTEYAPLPKSTSVVTMPKSTNFAPERSPLASPEPQPESPVTSGSSLPTEPSLPGQPQPDAPLVTDLDLQLSESASDPPAEPQEPLATGLASDPQPVLPTMDPPADPRGLRRQLAEAVMRLANLASSSYSSLQDKFLAFCEDGEGKGGPKVKLAGIRVVTITNQLI